MTLFSQYLAYTIYSISVSTQTLKRHHVGQISKLIPLEATVTADSSSSVMNGGVLVGAVFAFVNKKLATFDNNQEGMKISSHNKNLDPAHHNIKDLVILNLVRLCAPGRRLWQGKGLYKHQFQKLRRLSGTNERQILS